MREFVLINYISQITCDKCMQSIKIINEPNSHLLTINLKTWIAMIIDEIYH